MKKIVGVCLTALLLLSMASCSGETAKDNLPDGTYKVMDVRERSTNGYDVSVVLENEGGEREYYSFCTLGSTESSTSEYVRIAKTVPGDTVKIDNNQWTILQEQ